MMPSFLRSLLCVSVLTAAPIWAYRTHEVDIFDVTDGVLGMDKAVFEGPSGKGPRKNIFTLIPREHRAKYDQLKKESKDASELISNLIRNAYDVAVKGKNGKEALQGVQMQFNALSSGQKKKLLFLFPSLKSFFGHHSSQGSTSTEGPAGEIESISKKEKWSLQRAQKLLTDSNAEGKFSKTITSIQKILDVESWSTEDLKGIIGEFKDDVEQFNGAGIIDSLQANKVTEAFRDFCHVLDISGFADMSEIIERLDSLVKMSDLIDPGKKFKELSRLLEKISLPEKNKH